MTQHTDAERTEFEQLVRNKWPLANITRSEEWGYLDDDVDSKFFIYKAARRAPAAPVPQGYKIVPVEPTLEMRRAFDSAFTEYLAEDDDEKNDIWLIKQIIGAAPQPPEVGHTGHHLDMVAERHSFEHEEVALGRAVYINLLVGRYVTQEQQDRWDAWKAGAKARAPRPPESLKSEIRTTSTAPVQMPEPIAYLHECGKKPSLRTLEFSKVAIQLSAKGYKSHGLYTEQQVRQLLSNHGIKANK